MESPAPDKVVLARSVGHAFGHGETRKPVLSGNDLELRSGEIVVMTGPSGSGKTTLLTLVGALRSVQEGSIVSLGRDLARLTPRELVEVRREIGFIFQKHNLFESLTAQENVGLALDRLGLGRNERDRRSAEMLARLGLGERLEHKPEALSGGQSQRVAIARALVGRPRLILADEPTAALDAGAVGEVVALLRAAASEGGAAVLMVTHDNRILDSADRIVNMVDGRIVSDAPVNETLRRVRLLQACPLFEHQPPAALAEFAHRMERERFPPGAFLVRRGDPGDRFYVIASGSVEVRRAEHADTPEPSAVLGPGGFFGETAILSGAPRNADVVGREPVEALSLGSDDFREALRQTPKLEQQVRDVLYQRR